MSVKINTNVRLAAKLTGYQITIQSAGGKVASAVTGQEEYEIDTFKGLEPETREKLIQFKLTTLADLSRFRDKWQNFEEVSAEQKDLLAKKVEVYDKEEAERNELRAQMPVMPPVAA